MSVQSSTFESTVSSDSLLSPTTDVSTPVKSMSDEERLNKIAEAYKTILECIGEDPDREGLKDTPMRAAKALQFFSKGYKETAKEKVGTGIFKEDNLNGDLVVVKDIEFFSHCEHHLVPFHGVVHIAYQPRGQILGLSKLARIVEVFSRRLQVQERLGREIADAIQETADALGVAVMIEASHMCMVMRGIEKTSASTTTTAFLGSLREDRELRREFFYMLGRAK